MLTHNYLRLVEGVTREGGYVYTLLANAHIDARTHDEVIITVEKAVAALLSDKVRSSQDIEERFAQQTAPFSRLCVSCAILPPLPLAPFSSPILLGGLHFNRTLGSAASWRSY